ncbi:hypothetical protein VUR80DRAFT_4006 [Thermomyces stellatus]
MPSILKTVIQSAVLKSAANLTVQLASRWQASSGNLEPIDWRRVIEFAVFGLIQAQLNCWWQQFLEDAFPSRSHVNSRPGQDGKATSTNYQQSGIKWRNIICKLLLDQSLGLFIMNTTFLICTNAVRLKSVSLVFKAVREKIWPIIRAAWKLWPWVSICNFLWVPVERRVLVASCVGFGWNMILAAMSMAK